MSAVRAVTVRVRGVREAVARTTLIPLLLRVAVFATVSTGFAVAYPVEVWTGEALPALLLAAALPALGPRRFWPTFAALVTVAGWLYTTLGRGEPIALWRLLALAVLLYLGHSLAALAALLPHDAVVDPALVLRWLARAAGVSLATSVLGVLLLTVAGLGGDRTLLTVTVVGLLVAVAVSALLGWLLRRP